MFMCILFAMATAKALDSYGWEVTLTAECFQTLALDIPLCVTPEWY